MHTRFSTSYRLIATPLVVAAVMLTSAMVFLAQDRPMPYQKGATWQATVYATREAMRDPADPLDGVTISVWSTSETYPDATLDTVLPPETNTANVPWTERPDWGEMARREIRASGKSVVYNRAVITAEQARTVNLLVEPTGTAVVWLNGKELVRGKLPAGNVVPLALQQGPNQVLVKLFNPGPHPMNPDPRYTINLVRPFEFARQRNRALDQMWTRLNTDFPDERSQREIRREQRDRIWIEGWPKGDVTVLAARYAAAVTGPDSNAIRTQAAKARTTQDLAAVRAIYNRARNLDEIREILEIVQPEAVRLAVDDLVKSFGSRYPKGAEYEKRLAALEKSYHQAKLVQSDDAALEQLGEQVRQYQALSREALLANPMLDFDKLLVIRRNFGGSARAVLGGRLGLPPGNYHTNEAITPNGWDNQIAVLSNLRGVAKLSTFYQPEGSKIISDVDLDFDAQRLMFSSIGSSRRWRVFELKANGTGLRQITPDLPDVDQFDSCYLPDGRIAFAASTTYQGMPCINGGAPMSQLFTSESSGKDIRQITFEQDSDWTPAVHENGRLMYLRWEYSDTPHYFSRLLFHSNPDGTGQMEYFHSNSYFPNGFFYGRSIPGHPSEVVGIISGHHGIPRSGRMLVYDPARGRQESDGAVRELPGGRGRKVDTFIRDTLVEGVWPHVIHPYPLADYSDFRNPTNGGKYFLVAMKRSEHSLWGIYLIDSFDNVTLLKEVEGAALLEPVPFRAVPRPPVIPDRVHPGEKEATVYLSDVYSGPGLKGIPRGKVKSLRLFSYHFNYLNTGGHASVGVQSGWDIKRILGTVPVEADGSASFKVPANVPISVQPLDEKGRALQLMRSWFTAMPGEVVSCVGCHDRQNSTPLARPNIASRKPPSAIQPWYGPARPFAYRTEVQPVLDRYCVSCHSGNAAKPNFAASPKTTFFTDDDSYLALQAYVHRYGPESDYHLPVAMEYHTSTSLLFQILDRGHHGVKLDPEAYDRLVTWADLNTPWRGSWGVRGVPGKVPLYRGVEQVSRRIELAKLYANVDIDPEREFAQALQDLERRGKPVPVTPAPENQVARETPSVPGWPFTPDEAKRKQEALTAPAERSFDLGNGARLDLVLVPAGSFIMGDPNGPPDAKALTAVRVAEPFYIGRFEITNRQYQAFNAQHDSRYINRASKDHYTPGYAANGPEQPVIRVTWEQAQAFCQWLSQKTGQHFSLPTEAQWEWAARAGTSAPYWFGSDSFEFGRMANLADLSMKGFRTGYDNLGKSFSFTHLPYVDQVNDGNQITAPVGQYKPNPWGLYDVQGNVSEWTLSNFHYFPYNDQATGDLKVARGGSWKDLPQHATLSYRFAYEKHQSVWDVGFRVVMTPSVTTARR